MEILMISDTKLKVMLDAEDLQSFSLTAEELDYNNTETKRMFWDVLSRAKQSVGFDTDGHRVLVQLFPSRSGGCEMFVSKLGLLCRSECDEQGEPSLSAVIAKNPRVSQSAPRGTSVSAFGFDTMACLLAVCRRLESLSYDGVSEAYLGDDRRCYLFLSDLERTPYVPLDEYAFIGEYGTQENANMLRHYVQEHARPICRGSAVTCLSQF